MQAAANGRSEPLLSACCNAANDCYAKWRSPFRRNQSVELCYPLMKSPMCRMQQCVQMAALHSKRTNMDQYRIDRPISSQVCFLGGSSGRQQRPSNFLDMHVVRAATPAEDVHFWMSRPDVHVLARQLIRVALFEMAQLAQCAVIQR